MLLGRARLAVQICSSPGLATKILIPAPALGSIDFTVTACVIFPLDLYPSYGSDNINVENEDSTVCLAPSNCRKLDDQPQ